MSTELITSEAFSLAELDEELQAKVLAASQQLKDSSSISISRIRLDQKSFIFPDGTETQNFSGIIVSAKHANLHYAGLYEEGKSNPPDCIAVLEGSNDAKNDQLSPNAEVFMKYCTNCNDCENFKWGSAPVGKGKACTEHVLLTVYVPSMGDELFLLECKKANAKEADGYIASMVNKYGHPVAVITHFQQGVKQKWNQEFGAQSLTSKDLVSNLVNRIDEANDMLTARIIDAYRRGSIAQPAPEQTVSGEAPGRAKRDR